MSKGKSRGAGQVARYFPCGLAGSGDKCALRLFFDPLNSAGWGEAADTVPQERIARASGVPTEDVALG